jgi:hypothetical protein
VGKSFPLSSARKIPRFISDHNPIILDTHEKTNPKSEEFRFEKNWISHPEFLTRVERAWCAPVFAYDSISIIQEKLKRVKKSLKDWGANVRGDSLKKKK